MSAPDNEPRRYYRTMVALVVLSEEPLGDWELDGLAHAVTEGDCVLAHVYQSEHELPEPAMALELTLAGSDPEFFGIEAGGDA